MGRGQTTVRTSLFASMLLGSSTALPVQGSGAYDQWVLMPAKERSDE